MPCPQILSGVVHHVRQITILTETTLIQGLKSTSWRRFHLDSGEGVVQRRFGVGPLSERICCA